MRFCTITLGCKANQYDTGTIQGMLQELGHELSRLGDGCDVCIVNTCAVTAESARKSRQAVRRARKIEPDALIVVCGCWSQLESEAASHLGADIVCGTGDKNELVGKIERQLSLIDKTPSTATSATALSALPPRTRALLKIQDGCDNSCAYCIIPKARGKSSSVPLKDIASASKKLGAQGYKEIVITGIEISSYQPDLTEAVTAISKAAPVARLRLGSLNPDMVNEEFIEKLTGIPRLCNHFHISLQSGCDETLMRMRRKYNANEAFDAITGLRKAFPSCGVTADLIVGFPGETDDEFEQTLKFVDKAAFSAMHIFPYSPRPGTRAELSHEQIAGNIKAQRAKAVGQVAEKHSLSFKNAQLGKTLEVLFEERKGLHSVGHSSNYLTVCTHSKIPKNTIKNVKVTHIDDGILFAEIV